MTQLVGISSDVGSQAEVGLAGSDGGLATAAEGRQPLGSEDQDGGLAQLSLIS